MSNKKPTRQKTVELDRIQFDDGSELIITASMGLYQPEVCSSAWMAHRLVAERLRVIANYVEGQPHAQ